MASVVKPLLLGLGVTAVILLIGEVALGLVSTTVDYYRADLDAQTEGIIEESFKVYVRPQSRVGGHYEYQVKYTYEVAGRRYTSDRVNYSLPTRHPHAVVARYPVGTEVAVHYDSRRPALSALEPSKLDGEVWWLWAGMLAVLIGTTALSIYLSRDLDH